MLLSLLLVLRCYGNRFVCFCSSRARLSLGLLRTRHNFGLFGSPTERL